MPTVLIIDGFRFFFYSNENNDPAHVHAKKGSAEGKIWLESVTEVCYLHHFTKAEEKDNQQIIEDNFENIKAKWDEYFNK